MNVAKSFVLINQAGCQSKSEIVNMAEREATGIGRDDDGQLVELIFSDGSVVWVDGNDMGIPVQIGQRWETRGGNIVTIGRRTIDGSFYQFEGSNGVSYSERGRAFPDKLSDYDLFGVPL